MKTAAAPPSEKARHWDSIYQGRSDDQLSWDQEVPARSLRLIQEYAPGLSSRILDAGAGRSRLVDFLLQLGYRDVVLVDLSAEALDDVRLRLGSEESKVQFRAGDLTEMKPIPNVVVWHDRAVFHFLTAEDDRRKYVALVRRTVAVGGVVILATFSPDGPDQCSGLPVCRYDGKALSRQFGEGFELLHEEREEHRTHAGTKQSFTYVVFSRVGP